MIEGIAYCGDCKCCSPNMSCSLTSEYMADLWSPALDKGPATSSGHWIVSRNAMSGFWPGHLIMPRKTLQSTHPSAKVTGDVPAWGPKRG